jgi:hypothetical protein
MKISSSPDDDLSSCSWKAFWRSDFSLGDATPLIKRKKN